MDYLMKIRERAFFMKLTLEKDELREYLQGKSHLSKQRRKFLKLMLLDGFTDCLRISKEIYDLSNQGILQNTQNEKSSNSEVVEADRELGEDEEDSDEATENSFDIFSEALEEDKDESLNAVAIEGSSLQREDDSKYNKKE
jgi:hypothetical protein